VAKLKELKAQLREDDVYAADGSKKFVLKCPKVHSYIFNDYNNARIMELLNCRAMLYSVFLCTVTNCVPANYGYSNDKPVCRNKSIITSKYTVHQYFSTSARHTNRRVHLYDNVQNKNYIQSIL